MTSVQFMFSISNAACRLVSGPRYREGEDPSGAAVIWEESRLAARTGGAGRGGRRGAGGKPEDPLHVVRSKDPGAPRAGWDHACANLGVPPLRYELLELVDDRLV